ncbi:MAG TPA: tetratricopeptide repeat protein [Chthonomonadaceae bacterium]|nr:tetratricopeptide repeat protein [Chthonomonadaceae bacterium]
MAHAAEPGRPPDVRDRLARASQEMKAGKLSAALADLDAAARIAPGNPEVHRRLAALFARAGYLDREIDEMETILRLAPKDADTALQLSQIYLQLGWLPEARARLVQGARVAPNDVRVFLILATQAYMRFMYPQMEQAASEGLRRWPDNVRLTTILSEAERLQGHLPQAESLLRHAIAAAKNRSQREADLVGFAHLLLDKGWKPPRYQEAEQAARAALKLAPSDPEAHYWLGRALQLQGRDAQAIPEYAFTARQNPRFETVALYLGRLYVRSSNTALRARGTSLLALYDHEQSVADHLDVARTALREHPEQPEPHAKMAAVYMETNQIPEAIVELRRVLRMRPQDKKTRSLLVRALKAVGRNTEALAYAR